MIKFQQRQALTSHFENFWSIVLLLLQECTSIATFFIISYILLHHLLESYFVSLFMFTMPTCFYVIFLHFWIKNSLQNKCQSLIFFFILSKCDWYMYSQNGFHFLMFFFDWIWDKELLCTINFHQICYLLWCMYWEFGKFRILAQVL